MRSFVVFGCVAGGRVGVAGGRVKRACCFSCAISWRSVFAASSQMDFYSVHSLVPHEEKKRHCCLLCLLILKATRIIHFSQ